MDFINIRFNIEFKGGNKTFEMMNNLPISSMNWSNMHLMEGTTSVYVFNKSKELTDEYAGLVSFQIPTTNSELLFEKFVGGQAQRIKENINKLQDAKLDTKFCELEKEGVEIDNALIRQTRKEFPLVKSVDAIIYIESASE